MASSSPRWSSGSASTPSRRVVGRHSAERSISNEPPVPGFVSLIVEHSLTASDDSLRERIIGIEVFGRAPDYDTAEDPVVRLRAADVRKRLAQYYQAHREPLQWKVEIPPAHTKRSSIPPRFLCLRFQYWRSSIALQSETPGLTSATVGPSVDAHRHNRLWLVALLAVCLAMAVAGLTLFRGTSRAVAPFDLFWGPVLEDAKPVLICTGSNRVYVLSREARGRYRKSHPPCGRRHSKSGTAGSEGRSQELHRLRISFP